MQKTIVFTFAVALVCAGASAQSLGEIAKQAEAKRTAQDGDGRTTPVAKTYTEKDLKVGADSHAAVDHFRDIISPVTGPVDRSKFDKVYAAGTAMREGFLQVGASLTVADFGRLLVAFSSERQMASDHVTTKGERILAGNYLLAEIAFNLANSARRYGDADQYQKAKDDAFATLDAANAQYLDKVPAPVAK